MTAPPRPSIARARGSLVEARLRYVDDERDALMRRRSYVRNATLTAVRRVDIGRRRLGEERLAHDDFAWWMMLDAEIVGLVIHDALLLGRAGWTNHPDRGDVPADLREAVDEWFALRSTADRDGC